MKILHVIHSIDPRSGGPSHAIRPLVRAQAEAGHDVTLLATTTQSAEPWAAETDYVAEMSADSHFAGVELCMQPSYGRHRPWSRYAYSPASRRFLSNRLAEPDRRPDVVHIHGVFSHLTMTAARSARKRAIPYFIRPAGILDPWCLDHRSRWLKQFMLRTTLRRDLQQAARIQAMSIAEEEHLSQLIESARIVRLPHGSVCPDLPGDARESLEAQFPQIRGRRFVLFMGRIHDKKRPALAVDAVARVRDEFPDLALVIAGQDDGGLAAVKRAIEQHQMHDAVVFTGFLQGDLKAKALSASDVFILPSFDENFGVAVVEAMAHATPVLVTPGVATHEYVDASGGGLTVDGTPDAVSNGLRNLLREGRDRIGSRGREFAQRELTWSAIVNKLDGHYKSAITEAGRPSANAE